MKGKLLALLLGFLLGAPAMFFGERFVEENFGTSTDGVEGTVVGKQREGERLLLTVDGPEGASLATFTEKVPEIDLLIDEGDTVTMGLGAYEPFVENPPIHGVRKAELQEEVDGSLADLSGPTTDSREVVSEPDLTSPEPIEPTSGDVELEEWPTPEEPEPDSSEPI